CLPAAAQTADEIIAKNLAARGGADKIRSIKSLNITGRLTGPGMDAPIKVQLKRPNKFRMDLTVHAEKTITQAYDGNSGWQTNPFSEKADVETITGGDSKNVQDQADIDGPLTDYKTKGNQVDLIGKETVNGKACYKLKIVLNTGHIMYQYLDVDTF